MIYEVSFHLNLVVWTASRKNRIATISEVWNCVAGPFTTTMQGFRGRDLVVEQLAGLWTCSWWVVFGEVFIRQRVFIFIFPFFLWPAYGHSPHGHGGCLHGVGALPAQTEFWTGKCNTGPAQRENRQPRCSLCFCLQLVLHSCAFVCPLRKLLFFARDYSVLALSSQKQRNFEQGRQKHQKPKAERVKRDGASHTRCRNPRCRFGFWCTEPGRSD